MRARKGPFLLPGDKMKKVIFSLFILSAINPIVTMQSAQQLKKKRCDNCQQSCVDVCEQVKAKHKNLISQLHTFHKMEIAKAYGSACVDVETEGLECLFIEQDKSKTTPQQTSQKKLGQMFTSIEVPSVAQKLKNHTSQYTDIDSLLKELEQDIPKSSTPKKLTFSDHAKSVSELIMRGSAQALTLIRSRADQASCNNLDVTTKLITIKTLEFENQFDNVTDKEKGCLGLITLATTLRLALSAPEKLIASEKIIGDSFLADLDHSYSQYLSRLQILQQFLEIYKK